VIIVDLNGLKGFGTTADMADINPLAGKLRNLGLHVDGIEGHDCQAICQALEDHRPGPRAVILKTVKGYGVFYGKPRAKLRGHLTPRPPCARSLKARYRSKL